MKRYAIAGTVVVLLALMASPATAAAPEKYDTLSDLAGSFMNAHGNHDHPHYHGPEKNKEAHIDAGCAMEEESPDWFYNHYCVEEDDHSH